MILFFGLFLAVVPLLVYQGATLYSTSRILKETHAKELQHQTALTANLINQAIAEKVAFLGGLSNTLPYLNALPKARLQNHLETQKAERNDIFGIATGRLLPGAMVATAGLDAVLSDEQKPRALQTFLQGCGRAEAGQLLVSNAILINGAPLVFFCARAHEGGGKKENAYAVTLLAMAFHNIALLLSQFESELEGPEPVTLLDTNNRVVYTTDTTIKAESDCQLDVKLPVVLDEPLLYKKADFQGEEVLAAAEGLSYFGDNGGVGWKLVALLPQSAINAKLIETLRLNILLGLAIVLTAVLIGTLLAQNIARPLKRIVSAAASIREGDYDTRIRLANPPLEIASLAHTLNNMADRIQTRTQELQAQQNFSQFLLDASPIFMMTLRAGKIAYVNRRFLDYLGFDSLAAFLKEGNTLCSLIARIDNRPVQAPNESELLSQLFDPSTQHVVYFRQQEGGASQPFIAATARSFDADHSVLAFADISVIEKQKAYLDKKVQQAESARRAQQELLQMQSRQAQMGEMIGAIAHQWKQPLTVLSLQVQELEQMYADGDLSRDYLENYAAEAERMIDYMSKTVDDFRNFFRPAPAQIFSVRDAIERLLTMLGKLYEKQGIKIIPAIEQDARIKGSLSEFQQVLVNLINNARDAYGETQETDRRITVRLLIEENWAVVETQDRAGGIPETVLPRIFDSYFTTKSETQGTGIGLFMSKQIIEEKMGGTLSAENTAEGAKFTIRVPLS